MIWIKKLLLTAAIGLFGAIEGGAQTSVVAWGLNTSGQATVPAGLTDVVAVTGGSDHSLALKADGTVVAWGSNWDGQCTIPAGLSNVVAIAAGIEHSMALKADGTVVAWGANNYGQCTIPANAVQIVAIDADGYSSMALKSDGTVVNWGSTINEQTGPAEGLDRVVAIVKSNGNNLALRADGTVVTWGGFSTVPAGVSGVIAIDSDGPYRVALKPDGSVLQWAGTTFYSPPAAVTNVVSLGAGSNHRLAVKADGTVVAWVNTDTLQTTVPAGLTDVVWADGGGEHSLAITSPLPFPRIGGALGASGNVGLPFQFQLTATAGPVTYDASFLPPGLELDPETGLIAGTPTQARSFSALITARNANGSTRKVINFLFTAGAAPDSLNLSGASVSEDAPMGTVIGTWSATDPDAGEAFSYTLAPGTGATDNASFTVVGNQLITQVVLNYEAKSSYSIRARVTDSGANSFERVFTITVQNVTSDDDDGDGLTEAQETSAGTNKSNRDSDNDGATDGAEVSAGSNPLSSTSVPSRYVALWGSSNSYGQLNLPGNLGNIAALATGFHHAVAIRDDRTVVCWGRNSAGQTNVPAGLSDVVEVAAGSSHSMALKDDGTVVVWGSTAQTQIPADLSGVVAIASGDNHCLALKSDGTVVGWGSSVATFGKPSTAKDLIGIAGGALHSVTLRYDGATISWGQTNVPPGQTNVTAVSAFNGHTLFLRSNGTVTSSGSTTTVPGGLSNVRAVAAADTSSLALKNDGKVTSWSSPPPTGLANVSAIDAGVFWSAALSSLSPPPAITTAAMATGAVSSPYQFQIAASGSPGSYSAMGLPPGLSLATGTGMITGTPTKKGRFSVRLMAQNAHGVGSRVVSVLIDPGPQPVAVQLQPASIAEDAPVDTLVGTFSTTHQNPSAVCTYTLVEGSGSGSNTAFTLSGNELRTATTQNYETVSSRSIRVRSTDQFGNTLDAVIVVAVTNVTTDDDDYDGLTEGQEIALGTNPLKTDTDDDGTSDPVELEHGTNPLLASSAPSIAVWGTNTLNLINVPVGLTEVVALAAGSDYTLALKADGTVAGWGDNGSGQISIPADLTDVVAISAYGSNSLALKADGTVVAWGPNSSGVNNVPANLKPIVAIASGLSRHLALQNDGTVVRWGSDSGGLHTVPAGLTNVVGVAAGNSSNFAILSDGRLVGWGNNFFGQTVPPAGPNNFVDASGGTFHSMALRADGTVVAFGSGSQTNVPAGLADVAAIKASTFFSAALKNNGTVVTWDSSTVAVPAALEPKVVAIAAGTWHVAALKSPTPFPRIVSTGGNGVAGRTFSYQTAASGAPTNFRAIGLPAGLTLDASTGEISGTPLEAGNFSVRLMARNAAGLGSAVIPLTIAPPTPNTFFAWRMGRFSTWDPLESTCRHASLSIL